MSKMQNQIIALNIRRYIDQELEYFTKDPGGQAPENSDVKKGLDRAAIAISRAFERFYREHTR